MKSNGVTVERRVRHESPSLAVIWAVADALDADPTDIEPLYEVVDPDALDRLFRNDSPDGPRNRGRVTFVLEGCEVVLQGDGRILVTPPVEGDELTGQTA